MAPQIQVRLRRKPQHRKPDSAETMAPRLSFSDARLILEDMAEEPNFAANWRSELEGFREEMDEADFSQLLSTARVLAALKSMPL